MRTYIFLTLSIFSLCIISFYNQAEPYTDVHITHSPFYHSYFPPTSTDRHTLHQRLIQFSINDTDIKYYSNTVPLPVNAVTPSVDLMPLETDKATAFVKTELYFGLSSATGGVISEAEWANFLDTYVTPLFSEGLTVLNGVGQYKMRDGKIIKEQSKILILLHKNTHDININIENIRRVYKRLFNQESVIRTTTLTSVSF